MILTGIGDEAGNRIETQIKATLELGWAHIEARNVEVEGFKKGNLHDIPEAAFDIVREKLEGSGVDIYCFGSTIANWGKTIDQPFDLSELDRAIPRMQKLGTKYIRVMSYAIRDDDDQMEVERFRRLREITRRCLDAGIQPLHENCMNYGGMGFPYTLELLENVPGLKLVFDTANPVFNDDRTKPKPRPKQDPWEFWSNVKSHVDHIHVKDAIWKAEKQNADYTFPGEGDAAVERILADAFASGFDKGISIEPHMTVVFHDADSQANEDDMFKNYVEYGRRLMALIDKIKSRNSDQPETAA